MPLASQQNADWRSYNPSPYPFQASSEQRLDTAGETYGRNIGVGSDVIGRGTLTGQSAFGTFLPQISALPAQAELDKTALVGQAATDTAMAFDKAQGANVRQMSRMGVSPSSGRWAGLEQNWALARAAAEAGAKNRARKMVREEEWARKLQSAGIGQRLMDQAVGYKTTGTGLRDEGAQGVERIASAEDTLATDREAAIQEQIRMEQERKLQQQQEVETRRADAIAASEKVNSDAARTAAALTQKTSDWGNQFRKKFADRFVDRGYTGVRRR